MIYVVAGNMQQFRRWLGRQEKPVPNACYVTSVETLLGKRPTKVVFTGTYYERRDIFDIELEVERIERDGAEVVR